MTMFDDPTRRMLLAGDPAAAFAGMTDSLATELSRSFAATKALEESSAVRRMFEDLDRNEKMMRAMLGPSEEEVRRAALGGIDAAMKAFEESSAVRRMFEDLDRNEKIMRAMLGPSEEEARRAVLGDIESSLATKLMRTEETFAGCSGSFRLPGIFEVRPLLQQFQDSATLQSAARIEALVAAQRHQDDIVRAMEAMRSPWLNTNDVVGSIGAFAKLQAMGLAFRDFGAFDDQVASSLRGSLGDWRDTISWQDDIFVDPGARSNFYATRGLDVRLTSFPETAFAQAMDIAGLRRVPPVAFEHYRGEQQSEVDQEELGFERTSDAHNRLIRFETYMRRFIEERLRTAYGDRWMKERVPGPIYESWLKKRQKAQENGDPDRPIIAYADFTDYLPIITRNDNWTSIFKSVFRRRESVTESFQRLYPIRLCAMHARIVTQDDELYLRVEVKRLLNAIRVET